MSEQWTIDSIAHALPHSTTRQQFWTELNRTPVDQLPDVLRRWIAVAQEWVDAEPRIEALRQYYREHGRLPEDFEQSTVDITEQVLQDGRRGRGAA